MRHQKFRGGRNIGDQVLMDISGLVGLERLQDLLVLVICPLLEARLFEELIHVGTDLAPQILDDLEETRRICVLVYREVEFLIEPDIFVEPSVLQHVIYAVDEIFDDPYPLRRDLACGKLTGQTFKRASDPEELDKLVRVPGGHRNRAVSQHGELPFAHQSLQRLAHRRRGYPVIVCKRTQHQDLARLELPSDQRGFDLIISPVVQRLVLDLSHPDSLNRIGTGYGSFAIANQRTGACISCYNMQHITNLAYCIRCNELSTPLGNHRIISMLSSSLLEAPPPSLSSAEAVALANNLFDLRVCSSEILTGERDLNLLISCTSGERFVMKISNPAEDPELTDFQTAALSHVEATAPSLPIPRLIRGRDARAQQQTELKDGRSARVRLFSFLPGTSLSRLKPSPRLRANLATCLAFLDKSLGTFFHPGQNRALEWNSAALLNLSPLVPRLERTKRVLIEPVLERFASEIAPLIPQLRSQVTYNDLNPYNVLVSQTDNTTVTGLLDFGDIVWAPLVNDLAVAASYQFDGMRDCLDAPAQFISAYTSILPLMGMEAEALPDLIAARLATTVLITDWRAQQHPENSSYILRNSPQAIMALSLLGNRSADELKAWARRACGLDN